MNINQKTSGLAYSLSAIMPFAFQIIIMIIGMMLSGVLNIPSKDITSSQAFFWILLFFNQFAFFWVSVFVIRKDKINFRCELGINKRGFNIKYLVIGVVFAIALMFFMSPIVNAFVEFLIGLGYVPNESVIPTNFTVANFLLGIFIVCILPAVCEEILFRGMVLGGLKSCGSVFAIVMSSLLFMLMHQNIEQVLHQFIFACALAYIAIKTKSIIVPIILHFINNFVALTLGYVNITDMFSIIAMIVGGVICLAVIAYEVVSNKQNKHNIEGQVIARQDKKMFFVYGMLGIVFNSVMLLVGVFV